MKYAKLFASVVVFAAAVALRSAFGSSISTNGLTLVDLTTDDAEHCSGTTSGYFSGSGIQYAFNNDETLTEQRWALQNIRHGYVVYRFDAPTVVNGYGIWNYAVSTAEPTKRAPKAWTFEASNDGESWTVIDEQPAETGWSAGEFRCYVAPNKTPYTYYKMNISNSIEKHLQVAHFEYFKLSFAELYDQFPGEVTVNAGESTLEIDYTNKILGSETVSEAWIDYGESEDALTEHAQPAETTATGIKFLISELPKHTAYSLRISFKLTGYEETFVVPVFAAHTRQTATLVPGSTTYASAASWDINDVPSDFDTDVVIDGNPAVTSSVTVSVPANTAYTNGNTTVDAGDSVTLARTGSSQSSHNWYMSGLHNSGTFKVEFNAGKNNQSLWAHVKAGVFTNEVSGAMNITGSGYESCTCGFESSLDGSSNDGRIVVRQSSYGKKKDNTRMVLGGGGVFVNNGEILVEVVGSGSSSGDCTATMELGGGAILSGNGKVRVDNDGRTTTYMNAYLKGPGFSATVTNGMNHTIEASGIVDGVLLYNEGLFAAVGEANEADLRMGYYRSYKCDMTNAPSGRIVAVGPAGLQLRSSDRSTWNTRFTNHGLIESRTGSHIRFADGVNSTSVTTSESALGLGSADLELWGRIAGGGVFMHARRIVIGDGAVLAPGDLANTLAQDGETVIYGTGESTCGTLTFTNSLTLSAGTVSEFQFQGADRFDSLHVGGTLTVDGTLKVVGPAKGGTYRIITSDNPIQSENESFFAAIDMSAAGGASKPKLASGSTTIEEQVPTGEVDGETGEPIVETVSRTLYYIDATFNAGFAIIVR